MEIKEVKRQLATDPLRVCKHLFPAQAAEPNSVRGNEFFLGDIHGNSGDSLRVHLSGAKAGLWTDFADTAKGGDLIDLWQRSKGLTLLEALKEIHEFLGLETPTFFKEQKEYKRPSHPKELDPNGPVFKYLTEERLLTPKTLSDFGVGELLKYRNNDWAVFPSYRFGELIRCKFMGVIRDVVDGKTLRPFQVSPDAEQCLYGWQAIGDAREVTIDEGEINAMTLYQLGFPAMSVSQGAGNGGKNQWIDMDYDYLDRFEVIYIRADDDEPGKKMIEDVSNRLGKHRCRILRMPDDPNALLQQGKTKADFDQYYKEAEYLHPKEIKRPSDFREEVKLRFRPEPHVKRGFTPYFDKIEPQHQFAAPKLEFRYKEVTLWGGYSFEGKSQMLKQMQLDAMLQGEKCLVVDFEQNPEHTLHRLVRSALGESLPSEGRIDKAINWLDSRLWIYGRRGTATLQELKETMEYSAKRFGITQFFVDSLMRIEDVPEEDLDAQRRAINFFCQLADDFNCHIHLVAHFRKPPNAREYTDFRQAMPNRYQVSGSGKLSDAAFNVLLLYRNRQKEDLLNDTIDVPAYVKPENKEEFLENVRRQPDAILNCDKQRNGESWTGIIKLWWHQDSQQFLNSEKSNPRIYVDKHTPFV